MAISGRHCPSERAIVKTATAPDLSLRGGHRPTWQSREGTAFRNEPSSKRQPPPTCHCEEAQPTWQSREGTSSSYKVPIKTYQPIASVAALTAQPLAALPPYGCGVPLAGSERLAGWQYSGHVFYGIRPPSLSFRGAKRRGNLKQALTISPGLSCVPGVYCEIAAAPAEPRNDKSDSLLHPEGRKGKPESAFLPCHSEERSDVGISCRQLRFRRWLSYDPTGCCEIATAPAEPRNDKPESRCGRRAASSNPYAISGNCYISHSADRSTHLGFIVATSASFRLRDQPLICFSRSIAALTSGVVSK